MIPCSTSLSHFIPFSLLGCITWKRNLFQSKLKVFKDSVVFTHLVSISLLFTPSQAVINCAQLRFKKHTPSNQKVAAVCSFLMSRARYNREKRQIHLRTNNNVTSLHLQSSYSILSNLPFFYISLQWRLLTTIPGIWCGDERTYIQTLCYFVQVSFPSLP